MAHNQAVHIMPLLPSEEWKLVPNSSVEISNRGRVRKLFKNGTMRLLTPIKKIKKTGNYYMVVNINGKERRIGNLVAEAFLPPKKPGQVLCYRGLHTDVDVNNLYYNGKSAVCRQTASRSKNPVAKVDLLGNVLNIYPSAAMAARDNHCSMTTVYAHCRQESVALINGEFNFRWDIDEKDDLNYKSRIVGIKQFRKNNVRLPIDVFGSTKHIQYPDDTDPEVRAILDGSMDRSERIRVYYGNPQTGQCWPELRRVTGYVSKAKDGTPLLAYNIDQLSAPILYPQYIIKITCRKKVLYEHPNFFIKNVAIVHKKEQETYDLRYGKENIFSFPSKEKAVLAKRFLLGLQDYCHTKYAE